MYDKDELFMRMKREKYIPDMNEAVREKKKNGWSEAGELVLTK